MSEKIIIENFGGLKKVEFELRNINILIGPQASGKSVAVKLLYFFKNIIPREMLKSLYNGDNKREFDKEQKEKFINYFPKESWPTGSFKIKYFLGENWVSIERQNNRSLSFTYSEIYKVIFNISRKILKDKLKEKEASDMRLVFAPDQMGNYVISAKTVIGNLALFNQYFIPAGRSFFANVQSNIFSLLGDNQSLDPFLIEFGSFYEKFLILKDYGA